MTHRKRRPILRVHRIGVLLCRWEEYSTVRQEELLADPEIRREAERKGLVMAEKVYPRTMSAGAGEVMGGEA